VKCFIPRPNRFHSALKRFIPAPRGKVSEILCSRRCVASAPPSRPSLARGGQGGGPRGGGPCGSSKPRGAACVQGWVARRDA